MVDLSLVKPGMHLKVVDNMDPTECVSVPEMEKLCGTIVTCESVHHSGLISEQSPSKVSIHVKESGYFWNDHCFEYIVELDECDNREFDTCDLSELFA